MKTSTKMLFILFVSLLGVITVLGAPDPPPPNGRNQGPPPPPPGLPIDEYSLVFLFLSVIFGIYIIINKKKLAQ